MRHLATAFLLFTGVLFGQYGQLDPTFGDNGVVRTVLDAPSEATAVAVQADGRILLAGFDNPYIVITRLMPDGSLDASFSDDGSVVIIPPYTADFSVIHDLEVQPDGRIVGLGHLGYGENGAMLLLRLMPDGSLDTTFGFDQNGFSTPTSGVGRELRILPDSMMMIAGIRNNEIRVQRIQQDGMPDNAFCSGASLPLQAQAATDMFFGGMEVQPDGRVVICGTGVIGGWQSRFMARALTHCGPDNSVGFGGELLLEAPGGSDSFGRYASDVLLLPDGKFIVIGAERIIEDDTLVGHQLFITRLMPNFTIDNTFGTDGHVVGPVITHFYLDMGHGTHRALLQPDGSFVFIGSRETDHPQTEHYVWRMTADGVFDPTFGTAGLVTDPLGAGEGFIQDLALQPDGKILICGRAGDEQVFTVARLTGESSSSVVETEQPNSLFVFPVPALHEVFISGTRPMRNTVCIIYDAHGRTIRQERIPDATSFRLDVETLEPGLYHADLWGPDGSIGKARFIRSR